MSIATVTSARKAGPTVLRGWWSIAPITASTAWTRAIINAIVKSPVRERASTTTTLASAKERLRLAAYMALTCASPAEESAAIEKPALVNALAIVAKPQSQKRRDFI